MSVQLRWKGIARDYLGSGNSNHCSLLNIKLPRSNQHLSILQNQRLHAVSPFHLHLLIYRASCHFFIPCFYTAANQVLLCVILHLSLLKTSTWNLISNFSFRTEIHHRALLSRNNPRGIYKEANKNKTNHEHLEGDTCYLPMLRSILQLFLYDQRWSKTTFFVYKLYIYRGLVHCFGNSSAVGDSIYH